MNVTLSVETAGQRADQFLAARLDGLTRSAAQKLLEEGHVLCQGRPLKKNDRLKPGDQVAVCIPDPTPVELLPQDPHRHGSGAAAALEPLEDAVADCQNALPQLPGDVPLLQQGAEQLDHGLHGGLAGIVAVGHAAHAVTHHGEEALALQRLRIGGVEDRKGVLLPLPRSQALDVAHPEGRALGGRQLHGGVVLRHPAAAAKQMVKQAHRSSPPPASR